MAHGIDLESFSRKELEKLRADIDKTLVRLDSRRRDEARRAAEEAVRQYGFSLSEITGDKRRAASPVSAPKYRNPADPAQTWTGRGRQPGWIKQALAAGDDLSAYEI